MMKRMKYGIRALCAAAALAVCGCAPRAAGYVAAEGVMLGTTFRVTADVRGMTARQLRDAPRCGSTARRGPRCRSSRRSRC